MPIRPRAEDPRGVVRVVIETEAASNTFAERAISLAEIGRRASEVRCIVSDVRIRPPLAQIERHDEDCNG